SGSPRAEAISPMTVGPARIAPATGALIDVVEPGASFGAHSEGSSGRARALVPTSAEVSLICRPSRSGRTSPSLCGSRLHITTSVSEKQAFLTFATVTAMPVGGLGAAVSAPNELTVNVNSAAAAIAALSGTAEARVERCDENVRIVRFALGCVIDRCKKTRRHGRRRL